MNLFYVLLEKYKEIVLKTFHYNIKLAGKLTFQARVGPSLFPVFSAFDVMIHKATR